MKKMMKSYGFLFCMLLGIIAGCVVGLCFPEIAPYAEHIHVFYREGEVKVTLANAISKWQAYLGKFSTPRALLLEFMPQNSIEELKTEADALRKITGEMV